MEKYNKTQWVDKETRVTAKRMNNIEEGVEYSVGETINLREAMSKIMESITQVATRTTAVEDAIKNVSGGTIDLTEINEKIKQLEEKKAEITHTHKDNEIIDLNAKTFDDLVEATKKPQQETNPDTPPENVEESEKK